MMINMGPHATDYLPICKHLKWSMLFSLGEGTDIVRTGEGMVICQEDPQVSVDAWGWGLKGLKGLLAMSIETLRRLMYGIIIPYDPRNCE